MPCERCGKEISANAAICPFCGTVVQQSTTYGHYRSQEYDGPQPMPTYEHGYVPPLNANPSEPVNYSPSPPKQNFNYGPFSQAQGAYQPGPINVTVVNNFTTSSNNNKGALLAEIILSLFGIYGVGWLLAGETTIGVVLLICSFALFWPLAIMIAIFTLGFGIIFCNLPLAIGGIVLNAILLNNALNRKAKLVQYTTAQQQQRMPPRQERQW